MTKVDVCFSFNVVVFAYLDVRCSTFISYLIVTTKVNMFVLALKLSSALLPVKTKPKRPLYREITGSLHIALFS